jgi:SAM-dependent methyltransferase
MLSPLALIEKHLATSLLSPQGRIQYQKGDVSKSELLSYAPSIRKLSEGYTQHAVGTSQLPSIPSDLDAAAYALYYIAINAAKALHLIPLIDLNRPHIRVADFGCGPGTLALALLASSSQRFDSTLIEKSPHMLTLAQRLISSWEETNARGAIRPCAEIPTNESGSFDLVCAANSLAELTDERMLDTVNKLCSLLAPDGVLLLLEPGQHHHTRRLMALRDHILERIPALTPLFPCTRRDRCPMLTISETDWCHGTLEWQQPPLHAQLDRLLGFNKHRIKYSSFVFQNGAAINSGYRVIIPAKKGRQGIDSLLCGPDHYGLVNIKKGMRNEGNRALEKAGWFDRLRLITGTLSDTSAAIFDNVGEL